MLGSVTPGSGCDTVVAGVVRGSVSVCVAFSFMCMPIYVYVNVNVHVYVYFFSFLRCVFFIVSLIVYLLCLSPRTDVCACTTVGLRVKTYAHAPSSVGG